MALVVKDRVKQFSTTTGTGTITLGSTPTGFQPFSSIGDGSTTYYAIVDNSTGDWEVGLGTYTLSGTTLARTTVLASSNSGSLVSFGSDTKEVFVTYPAEKAVYEQASGVVEVPAAGVQIGTYNRLQERPSIGPGPGYLTISNNVSPTGTFITDGFAALLSLNPSNGALDFTTSSSRVAGNLFYDFTASGFVADRFGITIGRSFDEVAPTKVINFYTSISSGSGSVTSRLTAEENGDFSIESRRSNSNVIIKTNNNARLTVSTTQFTATLPWRGQNGTVSAPALSASADTNTGVYFPSADAVGITTGGTQRVLVNSTGVTVTGTTATTVIDAGNLVGQVAFFAMSTAPTGWLKANGGEISRTTYAALFAAIGTTYGAGDGSTTFLLPDLRDRVPIGAENLYALAATGGSKDAIVVDHTHTITDPGHKHTLRNDPDTVPDGGTGLAAEDGINQVVRADAMDNNTTGITINSTGSSGTDANLPPYLALVACIKF